MDNTPIPPPPTAVQTPCPNNHLVFSILTTLFCCLPTGIVAIIYSCKVDSLYNENRLQESQNASQCALRWSIVSIILGIVVNLLLGIVGFLYTANELEAQYTESLHDIPAEIQSEISDDEFEIGE